MQKAITAMAAGAACLGFGFAGPTRSQGEAELVAVTGGFGQLLPHRVLETDASGNPTGDVVDIRTQADLVAHVSPRNPILPAPTWPTAALLPSGAAGNHFLLAEFDRALDAGAFFERALAQGSVALTATNPVTGLVLDVPGQWFVGGRTVDEHGELQAWVLDNGDPRDGTLLLNPALLRPHGSGAFEHPADGFPGASLTRPRPGVQGSSAFAGADALVRPGALVFVPDQDGSLATLETLPAGFQVSLRARRGLSFEGGATLACDVLASSTVGPDLLRPEVALGADAFEPPTAATDVDPMTDVRIAFTEPVQLTSLGNLLDAEAAAPGSAVKLEFGPPTQQLEMPFQVGVESVFDLSRVTLTPAFAFPPAGALPAEVSVQVFAGQVSDHAGNVGQLSVDSFFLLGAGAALVNAPVTPDAIYLARFDGSPSLSVIDLNGFGATTGSPDYDFAQPIQAGHTNYPNNPNFLQGGLLVPPLLAGTSTFDGGSEGVFSLTKSSALDDRLVSGAELGSIADMMLGHALDTSFNNGPPPFGCQAGGGNACAFGGLKLIAVVPGGAHTLAPATFGAGVVGGENIASWAPHPNPPPLVFPPLCASPHIGGQEPTSIDASAVNLLVPGDDPFGDPALGLPPTSLLAREQNAFFQGASPPSAAASSTCAPYQIRQQVGHFLYALDRRQHQLVVLNSNRMTVLDRIALEDPTSMAMSPNLDLLAVTSRGTGEVTFVDIDPASSGFHSIVKVLALEPGLQGIAWDNGNERIFACNEERNTVTLISAFSLSVAKVLTEKLAGPFEVALTPRQDGFGFGRGVYFGYILNRDGSVSVFESGPDGINGWGYDDVILKTSALFPRPQALQVDPNDLNSAVWIAHAGSVSGGALSRFALTTANQGLVPLAGSAPEPNPRDMLWEVADLLGPDVLTGVPVDLAFDDQLNLAGLPGVATVFGASAPAPLNGKGLVRNSGGTFASTNAPRFLFAAVPRSAEGGGGVVDVIDLVSLTRQDTDVFQAGVQSIQVGGVQLVMDFFRQ